MRIVPVVGVVGVNDTFVEDHVAAADASSAAESRQDAAAVSVTQLHRAAGGRSFAFQTGLRDPQCHQELMPHLEVHHFESQVRSDGSNLKS